MGRAEILEVVEFIKEKTPYHGIGVVAPGEIVSSGRSNCFGKVALVAGGLVVEQIFERSEMGLIISQNHGTPKPGGKPLYGHAALIVPGEAFVDADSDSPFLRTKANFNWDEDPAHPYHPVQVRGSERGSVPPGLSREQWVLQYRYTLHPLEAGIAAYQQEHEELRDTDQTWTLGDYAEAYTSFPRS